MTVEIECEVSVKHEAGNAEGELDAMIVLDKNGLQGTFDLVELSSSTEHSGKVNSGKVNSGEENGTVVILFDNGQHVAVPREMLIRQADGRYTLDVSVEELMASEQNATFADSRVSRGSRGTTEELVIPVIEEQISVQKYSRETGVVEIRKTVHERTEVIDHPLLSEEVEIERISVNRIVDEPIPVRHEGDTMIIPLLEEVLVVEKRLVLREEVHVKRVQRETRESKSVLLREERVEIARRDGDGSAGEQEAA
jgi:uncharacterized protein (TIGR02271 family)